MDYTNLMSQALKRQESARGKSAFKSPEGRMVGGVYIAPNPLEYLSEALRSAGAGREAEMAGQEIQGYETQRNEGTQKALAEFLRQSQGQAAQPEMQGNNPSAYTPPQAAQAPNMQGAYASLMQAPDQSMRQMGMQGMVQLPQIQAQQQEREENRAFRTEESRLSREARAQELQQRMTDARASQTERLQAQKELREMQIQAQKDTQRMIAANRPERQAQIIQTDAGPMQLVDGKAVPIAGPDGKPVSSPKKGAAGLSATAQKELFEADDAVQNGMGAVTSLQKAMELNKDAYSGVGAATRATIRSNLPGTSEAADATIAMENIIKDQALTSMKSIFGGNPTEGERAILLDLQASASKTLEQRAEILGRAMQAAQRRTEFNKQKADALRSGSYMSEGGAPAVPTAPTPPGKPKAVNFGDLK